MAPRRKPDAALGVSPGLAQARAALARAAVTLDQTSRRGRAAGSADTSAPWNGFAARRWSIVDEFEADGRRYVVARESDSEITPAEALPPREYEVVRALALGQPTKHIAFELGIAHSTVRVLLRRAMRRLNVKSRAALVSSFNEGWRAPADREPDERRAREHPAAAHATREGTSAPRANRARSGGNQ